MAPAYRCADRGGSTLQTCTVTGLTSGHLDTANVGAHAWTVTAQDGAGNTTSVVRHYTVRPAARQPDGLIRKRGRTWWKGGNVYGSAVDQTVRQRVHRRHTAVARWRVQNDGERADSFRLVGAGSTKRWKVRYFAAGVDVTRAVASGSFRTGVLAPGQQVRLRVTVTPTRRARVGGVRVVTLRAVSTASATAIDNVATRVTARR